MHWYWDNYAVVHVFKPKGTDKAQRGMKYAKHAEYERQEKGWLTCIHYEGREVWVKWHAVPQEATAV